MTGGRLKRIKNYLNNEHINTFLKTKNIDTTTVEKFNLGFYRK